MKNMVRCLKYLNEIEKTSISIEVRPILAKKRKEQLIVVTKAANLTTCQHSFRFDERREILKQKEKHDIGKDDVIIDCQ